MASIIIIRAEINVEALIRMYSFPIRLEKLARSKKVPISPLLMNP
jgi:hypothetical protein